MLKTHSGCKKRFVKKPNGTIKKACSYRRHLQRNRNPNTKRGHSGICLMNIREAKRIKQLI